MCGNIKLTLLEYREWLIRFHHWMLEYRCICIWKGVILSIAQQFLFVALITSFIAKETDKYEPKPYLLENGDTLMVREKGYGFCPKYCDVDHFHIGHKKNYNCETDSCTHIVYNDRLN